MPPWHLAPVGSTAQDRTTKECPLCQAVVPGGVSGMNRHFETDCPWRHTRPPPSQGAPSSGKPDAPRKPRASPKGAASGKGPKKAR
jgi:hypothetical protein